MGDRGDKSQARGGSSAAPFPPLGLWVQISQALFVWGSSYTHFLIVLLLRGEGSRPTCSLLLQHREKGGRKAGSGHSPVVTTAPSSHRGSPFLLHPCCWLLEGNRPAPVLLTDLSPNQSSPSWSPARGLEIPSHTALPNPTVPTPASPKALSQWPPHPGSLLVLSPDVPSRERRLAEGVCVRVWARTGYVSVSVYECVRVECCGRV